MKHWPQNRVFRSSSGGSSTAGRRDFLKGVVAAGMVPLLQPTLLQPTFAANSSEQSDRRLGDLLFSELSTDHFSLRFTPKEKRPLRLLQLTDTHFHPGDLTNRATELMLRSLIERERPDFIVHTGDFVNNDSDKPVDWAGLDIVNGLRLPWTLCFGNHDYPVRSAPGSLPLDQIRQGMQSGFQGYFDDADGRHYCYRYDVMLDDHVQPDVCLFFFQVGYATGDRCISAAQLNWFEQQMAKDAVRGATAPITVFVHIPLVEYNQLFEAGLATGERGEEVCFDSDTGLSFRAFSQSGRVKSVFCGHDHVNNYFGSWKGTQLVYGRVSGWGGYGPLLWKRGGRLLTFDLDSPDRLTSYTEVY